MDLKLPSVEKERLWRTGLVSNSAVMDVLSSFSQNWITSEAEAAAYVDEAILTDSLIKRYAQDFFSGMVPAEVYYLALARTAIQYEPHWFSHLPENYSWIASQLNELDARPDRLPIAALSPQTELCHHLECYLHLRRLRYALRSGNIVAGGEMVSHKLYNPIVPHVKADFYEGPSISKDCRLLTQDIDFIVNYYNADNAWYIKTAAEKKENVLDNDFVFIDVELPETPNIKYVFDFVYNDYKEKCEDGYSAYYKFCEEVLWPLSIFIDSYKDNPIDESVYIFALTHRTRLERKLGNEISRLNDNPGLYIDHLFNISSDSHFINDSLSIPQDKVDAFKSANILSDMVIKNMRMWGKHTQPYIYAAQVDDFYTRLRSTESLSCNGLPMHNYLIEYRKIAANNYNIIAKANPKLTPVYSPPSPTN